MLWEGEAFLEKPCNPAAILEAVSLLLFGRVHRTETVASQLIGMRALLGSLAKNPRTDVV